MKTLIFATVLTSIASGFAAFAAPVTFSIEARVTSLDEPASTGLPDIFDGLFVGSTFFVDATVDSMAPPLVDTGVSALYAVSDILFRFPTEVSVDLLGEASSSLVVGNTPGLDSLNFLSEFNDQLFQPGLGGQALQASIGLDFFDDAFSSTDIPQSLDADRFRRGSASLLLREFDVVDNGGQLVVTDVSERRLSSTIVTSVSVESPTPVPAPPAAVLLLTALVGFGVIKRRSAR